jgi:acetone carboxylase gamma subunit
MLSLGIVYRKDAVPEPPWMDLRRVSCGSIGIEHSREPNCAWPIAIAFAYGMRSYQLCNFGKLQAQKTGPKAGSFVTLEGVASASKTRRK